MSHKKQKLILAAERSGGARAGSIMSRYWNIAAQTTFTLFPPPPHRLPASKLSPTSTFLGSNLSIISSLGAGVDPRYNVILS